MPVRSQEDCRAAQSRESRRAAKPFEPDLFGVKVDDQAEWLFSSAASELALGAELRGKSEDLGAFALLCPTSMRMKHPKFPGLSAGVPDHG
jgi:hypothetical protein